MYERMRKTTLAVDGMHCGSCVAAVSSALRRLPSVHVERAVVGEVTVTHDSVAAPRGALVSAIEHAGYQVGEEGGVAQPTQGGCCGSRRPQPSIDAHLTSRAHGHRQPR
jgi:copper chaperone